MEEGKECPLFRRSEGLRFGKEIGYCDIDGESTSCDAKISLCKKTDALKQYFQRNLNKFGKKGEVVGLSFPEDRRQHPRYSVKLPLDFWQTPDVVQGGLVTDMSEAGLGFRSIHEIQIGAELKIRVYLPREDYNFDSIEGIGRIIWRTPHREEGWKGYRYGMYILKMALHSRDRLLKYIKILEEEESSSH
jgi:hypothetical protein